MQLGMDWTPGEMGSDSFYIQGVKVCKMDYA
jgi:hypothetical protein